jgi:hypothetical protein
MHTLRFIAGLLLIGLTLLDGFETILLPRRINHRFRYSRLYYRTGWRLWRSCAGCLTVGKWREAMLSGFGPLSLLGLFVSWMLSLVVGFALLQWSLDAPLAGTDRPGEPSGFIACLYYSGTTCFTLGLGDLTPQENFSRALTVAEGGVGFGFLAIIIGYLPVLYQAFSRREVAISLFDARAGSPPTGGEFVLRLAQGPGMAADESTLREWERWSAELLESHISFPVLAFYRSQHSNQSWLATLATMLDACAILLTVLPPGQSHQVELTFAMARHAAVDIGLIFSTRPQPQRDRLPASSLTRLDEVLRGVGGSGERGPFHQRLAEIRAMYEPFLESLAERFLLTLPPVIPAERSADNWQRSAWMPRTPGIGSLPAGPIGSGNDDRADRDHFI